MNKFVLIGCLLGLTACNPNASTADTAMTVAASSATAGAALASSAVATKGQEYCAKATVAGPLIVALVDLAGVPVTVTDLASSVVASACRVWSASAVPVSPPAATVAVPIVAVAVKS